MRSPLDLSWITHALAIGGRFPGERTGELAREHGIRAVIDLRAEACDDEMRLRRHDIAFLHLPTDDHCAITDDMLRDGLEFATHHLAAGHRTLVHCEHGIGRSALLALCILVEHGHAPIDALALAKDRRARVSPSPAQYEAWAIWLRRRGLDVPEFQTFAAIAYRHLGVS